MKQVEAWRLAQKLKALSSPMRIHIVTMAVAQPGITTSELTAQLPITEPTVSHHARILAQAGLLVQEKRGAFVHHTVDRVALTALAAAIGGLP